ncbi:hypothetical protein PHISP_07613 [Aspergillus sp. HF37]|nr:hypothetical protein PHISP_07613 [Aspergillus sp. HF37]
MPTAIITGATGILGRAILQALSADPTTWPTVHALSHRKPPPDAARAPNIHHDQIDLLSPPETLAMQLQGSNVQGEYLFFAAYLQRGDEREMERVNGDMLRNLLTALAFTGAERHLKRVLLTTGAKHYGVHLGPVKCPMEEGDRWVEGRAWPPNFYYRQQRILGEMSARSREKVGGKGGGGGGWDWVVTYPNDVIGVATGNFMNLTTALALYTLITKELSAPFIFPGSRYFYTRFDSFTSARQHARFSVWAALTPACGGQAFNVVDGEPQSWQTLWPRLARRFGLGVPADQFGESVRGDTEQDERVVPLVERAPLAEYAEEIGIGDAGQVRRGEVRMRIDLLSWASLGEVRAAWERVAQREGLRMDAFEQATWFFLNFVLGRNYDMVISMSKARRFGFLESVDSWDALNASLDELVDEGILPRF